MDTPLTRAQRNAQTIGSRLRSNSIDIILCEIVKTIRREAWRGFPTPQRWVLDGGLFSPLLLSLCIVKTSHYPVLS